MTPPRKIKVNNVRVGDRTMSIGMEPGDNGNFPPFVKVDVTASVQSSNPSSSSGAAPAAPQAATVTVAFSGPPWMEGSILNYVITAVFFSSDNVNWTPFAGTLEGGSGSGTVRSNRAA